MIEVLVYKPSAINCGDCEHAKGDPRKPGVMELNAEQIEVPHGRIVEKPSALGVQLEKHMELPIMKSH
jgi:hypothetical protein